MRSHMSLCTIVVFVCLQLEIRDAKETIAWTIKEVQKILRSKLRAYTYAYGYDLNIYCRRDENACILCMCAV